MRITDLDKLNFIKLGYSGLVSGSSQFSLLPLLSQKMTIASKVVQCDPKIIIEMSNITLNLFLNICECVEVGLTQMG